MALEDGSGPWYLHGSRLFSMMAWGPHNSKPVLEAQDRVFRSRGSDTDQISAAKHHRHTRRSLTSLRHTQAYLLVLTTMSQHQEKHLGHFCSDPVSNRPTLIQKNRALRLVHSSQAIISAVRLTQLICKNNL